MAITCAYHKKAEAVGACVNCGKLICDECRVTLKGKLYCNPCVEEMYAEKALMAESAVPVAATAVVESTPAKEVIEVKAETEAKPAAKAKEAVVSKDNTSGQGKNAVIPEEIKGFNGGAFLMSWIWGIGNKVWISLLALIPYVNLVMSIVLGIKGSEWAWRYKQWDSIEHFKKVQRTWKGIGIALLIVSLVLTALSIIAYVVLLSSGGSIQF